MKKILFKDIKKGDRIRVWIDSDLFNRKITQVLTAHCDAIDLTNCYVSSGYGIIHQEPGLMFIADGEEEFDLLEENEDE